GWPPDKEQQSLRACMPPHGHPGRSADIQSCCHASGAPENLAESISCSKKYPQTFQRSRPPERVDPPNNNIGFSSYSLSDMLYVFAFLPSRRRVMTGARWGER